MELIDFDEGKLLTGPPDGIVISYDLRSMLAYCKEREIMPVELSDDELNQFVVGSFRMRSETEDE